MAITPEPFEAPALITPEEPPVVGVGSPWRPANGENRDRILDWWRSWWSNVFFPWVTSLTTYLNTWFTAADDYIVEHAISGLSWYTTLDHLTVGGTANVLIENVDPLRPLAIGDLVASLPADPTADPTLYGRVTAVIDATHATVTYIGDLQGPPGPNTIPTDVAVAGLIPGPSDTNTALDAYLDPAAAALIPGPSALRAALDADFRVIQGGRVQSACIDSDTLDQTATLNAEISALAVLGGGVIDLPFGTIIVDGVVMKNRVTLSGAGSLKTRLTAKVGGTAPGVIMLDIGPVQLANIEDLAVIGVGTVGQRGIYFKAAPTVDAPFHGGWWQSAIRRVYVSGFASDCIWLQGTGASALHQFLVFDQVQAIGSATGAALRVTGKGGQVEAIGCTFDGPGQALGTTNTTNVIFTREVDDALVNTSDLAPYSWAFRGCTFQSNKLAVSISRATPIVLDSCYFENLGQGVLVALASNLVVVDRCSFRNVGVVGDASGYVASVTGVSRLNFTNNLVFSTPETGLKQSTSTLYAKGNVTTSPLTTSGLTGQISVSAGGEITPLTPTSVVNASAVQITTLTYPSAAPGESVYFKPTGGPIVFVGTGNINIGGRTSPFTLAAGSVATFTRFDLTGTWVLTAVSA